MGCGGGGGGGGGGCGQELEELELEAWRMLLRTVWAVEMLGFMGPVIPN